VKGDVTDPDAVSKAVQGAELVIHLAGVVGMRLAMEKSCRAFHVSRAGTELLLRHCAGIPVVLLSTSAIYGTSDSGQMVSETKEIHYDQLMASDGGTEGYACGKWQIEQLGLQYMEKGPALIVRPFNVVGPRQLGCYGMVLPRFVKAALANENLTVFDDGLQTRSFTDVFIFVEALISLIQNAASWRAGNNIVNVGNDRSTSIKSLAVKTIEITSSKGRINYVPYETVFPGRTDIRHRMPDCSRLYSLIGKVNWPGIDSVIRRTVEPRPEFMSA
jgi:UDP-glucose 4-epimerase